MRFLLSFLLIGIIWQPSGVSSLSGRSHPPGWHKKWSPEWPWHTEKAQRAEPVACYPPAGCCPGPSDPGCPLHGVLGPQPGWHQGRVHRGREGLPQPSAHSQQETLHLTVEVCKILQLRDWKEFLCPVRLYIWKLMQNEVWAQSSIVSVNISNNYNSDELKRLYVVVTSSTLTAFNLTYFLLLFWHQQF